MFSLIFRTDGKCHVCVFLLTDIDNDIVALYNKVYLCLSLFHS